MISLKTGKSRTPVSVISVGASTSIGFRAVTTAASVETGINRFAKHPFMIDAKGQPYITAHAPYLPSDMVGVDRFWELALLSLDEVLKPLESLSGGLKIPLIVGLPAIRAGFTDKMVVELKQRFVQYTHPYCSLAHIDTICCGHSSGLMALEEGCKTITGGLAPFCLIGGIESWINPDDLELLDMQSMLHSDSNPWGLIPGEGAGFCLLTSEKTVENLGLITLANILAGETVLEQNLVNSDEVCTGVGLSMAMSSVIAESDISDCNKVDQIICDLNGLRYRADELGFSLVKNGKFFKAPGDFIAPADNWGDVGAASGLLFLSLAINAALKGNKKGPTSLLIAGSDSGERSAMLIKKIETIKAK